MIKSLRCLLTRDFDIPSLITMWDYIFSGISDESRHSLEINPDYHNLIYENENYFTAHADFLIYLDYVCIALLEYQKP